MKRFALFCLVCLLCTPGAVSAQDYGKRSVNFCTMQISSNIYGYNAKNIDDRLGAYKFDVNALFDAGLCTGQAPPLRTTLWQYCDFRGLVAADNFVSKADDILRSGSDTQDLYMRLIRRKIMQRYSDFLSRDDVRKIAKYENGADIVAAMIYLKGFKAVQLYFLTDISPRDRNAVMLRDQWNILQDCAGGFRPIGMTREQSKPAPVVPPANIKVPVDFNWKPFTKETEKLYRSTSKVPVKQIDELIRKNETYDILYDTIDLNGDGNPGLQFMLNSSFYCGSGGCMYVITDNNGELSQTLTTTKIRPAGNGVYVNGVYSPF